MKTIAQPITGGYKVFLLLFLGMLTAFGPFVTDMYLPALPSMTEWFATSPSAVQLSLTSCMVGLAVGQLVFGPMSDRYGRKPVLAWTLALFIVATLLCLLASDIHWFVAFRLVQGITAAGSIVIARSVSTDGFEGRDLAKILAVVGSINGVAPVLAPVMGGTMTESTGWKGIFVVLLFIGAALLVATCYYKETLPRERRVHSNLLHTLSYFKPLGTNRPYMGYMFQLGFAQAVLFANIASAPFLMQEHYGFTPFQFSVCFGMNALAVVVSAALAAKFRQVEKGTWTGSIGLFVCSIGEMVVLFCEGGFWAYEFFIVGILFSLGFCFTSSTTLAMDRGRKYAGSASALLGAVSFAFGGMVSPLVGIGNPLKATGIVFVACAAGSLVCTYVASGKRVWHRDE